GGVVTSSAREHGCENRPGRYRCCQQTARSGFVVQLLQCVERNERFGNDRTRPDEHVADEESSNEGIVDHRTPAVTDADRWSLRRAVARGRYTTQQQRGDQERSRIDEQGRSRSHEGQERAAGGVS